MKIVLLGAPGSGKGTLAKKLVGKFNIPTISTGDLLRNIIKEGTALGLEAKSYMDEGKLVPTELVLKLLKERLAQSDTENGYILDGFPRSLEQAELLDKMITAMGLKREQVFIGNIAKCHPMVNPADPEAHGNDRAPNAGEIAVCRKYIERQIAVISPKYVVALGGVAAKALISDTKSLGALRGKFHLLHLDSVELKTPVKILATYHPAALLRNPNWKKDAWADLQMVMAEMGLKRPQA